MFEVTKKQEETRQAEFTAKSAEFKAMQAHAETVRLCDFAQASRCYNLEHISSLNTCLFVSLIICFLVWQERQKVIYEEQKKLAQQQAQIKSQMARYEDELARKRMQACGLKLFYFKLNIVFDIHEEGCNCFLMLDCDAG